MVGEIWTRRERFSGAFSPRLCKQANVLLLRAILDTERHAAEPRSFSSRPGQG